MVQEEGDAYKPAALVEVDLLVHSIHLLVVPGISIVPQPLENLLESVSVLRRSADRLFNFRVILHALIVKV